MINIHIRMILLRKQKWGPKRAYLTEFMASALCFLSGVACPQNHTFERLFINFRAVLYGLAENYTQAFGLQKKLNFPIDPARTASQNKWIQHNIIHAGFNFDRSHSWAFKWTETEQELPIFRSCRCKA